MSPPSAAAEPVPTRESDGGAWHLRARHLHKRYPGAAQPAVRDLDLTVSRGSVFGLLGPNGAGKTTTLSMLSGLLTPDRGQVEFSGHTESEMRHRIGIVPQSLALYEKLSARENLEFFGQLYGVGGKRLARRCDELLAVAGLVDRADERIERFSTGMKRRLNLVAALVHEPEVVLLDEPTVGIDPQSRNRIFELVLELGGRGVSVLYTTHYMEEASLLCDRIAIMDHGRILVEDTPQGLVAELGVFRVDWSTDTVSAALVDEIRERGEVQGVDHDEELLSITVKDHEAAMGLIAALPDLAARQGTTTRLRRVVEPNLEAVFLSLTGRSLRDEPE